MRKGETILLYTSISDRFIVLRGCDGPTDKTSDCGSDYSGSNGPFLYKERPQGSKKPKKLLPENPDRSPNSKKEVS